MLRQLSGYAIADNIVKNFNMAVQNIYFRNIFAMLSAIISVINARNRYLFTSNQ